MIDFKNIDESELMNYLMTSDFDERLLENEYRYLLKRLKHLYKAQKFENINLVRENENLKRDIKRSENNIIIAGKETELYKKQYENLRKRKLKFSERFKGYLK